MEAHNLKRAYAGVRQGHDANRTPQVQILRGDPPVGWVLPGGAQKARDPPIPAASPVGAHAVSVETAENTDRGPRAAVLRAWLASLRRALDKTRKGARYKETISTQAHVKTREFWHQDVVCSPRELSSHLTGQERLNLKAGSRTGFHGRRQEKGAPFRSLLLGEDHTSSQ